MGNDYRSARSANAQKSREASVIEQRNNGSLLKQILDRLNIIEKKLDEIRNK